MLQLTCANNPACNSTDPAKNPILQTQGFTKLIATTPQKNGNTCYTYSDNTGLSTTQGCVGSDGKIVFPDLINTGVLSGDPTALGTVATTDNTGKTSVAPLGGTPTGQGCTAANALIPSTWFDCIISGLGFFILTLVGFLLGVVGVLLNWVVVKTVFQFSQLIGNSAGLITAWGILRDIGNLLLLFGFVLMGIGTILDTNKLPDKKAIPKLIIFAILLNFSIFAAEAVIDTSNVLTTVLYTQANTNPCFDDACNINNGIAGHIMQATGLSGIYALEGAKDINGASGNAKVIVILGLSLFGLIGIVVLLATAIMLAFRAIVLTGLIIVSPIGFAGMALPKPFSSMATKWWNALIHQAFFAPILFLLIFVDLKVTEGFSSASNNNNLASALTGATGTSNMGIIMVFMLISGGLIAALMAAKSFGAMGADFAISTAGKVTGRATFGTGALVMRQTVGNASNFAARKLNESTWARSSRLGRIAIGTAQAGANASFDVRGSKAFGGAVGAVGKGTKIKLDLGKPQGAAAKGIAGIEKRDIDARVKYGQGLKMSEEEEATKKDIETELEKLKGRKGVLTKEEDSLKKEKTAADNALAKGAEEFDPQIADLTAKVAANKDNAAVNTLDAQISAEKLTGQRARSLGSIEDAAASERRVKELEAQRDEYVSAGDKLIALQKAKATKLKDAQENVNRIDEQLKKKSAELEQNDSFVKSRTAILNQHLDAINPQVQYINALQKRNIPFVDGRTNKEAAKRIQAGLKKNKTEKALDSLKGALESGAKDISKETAAVAAAINEENEKADENKEGAAPPA